MHTGTRIVIAHLTLLCRRITGMPLQNVYILAKRKDELRVVVKVVACQLIFPMCSAIGGIATYTKIQASSLTKKESVLF